MVPRVTVDVPAAVGSTMADSWVRCQAMVPPTATAAMDRRIMITFSMFSIYLACRLTVAILAVQAGIH
jgi:hypothetical protein